MTKSKSRRSRNKRRPRNKRSTRVRSSHAPTSFGQTLSTNANRRDIRIQNREYICDLTSTESATREEIIVTLNPGSDEAFPWLSRIATGYETYVVHNFTVKYTTSLPTTSSGAVYLVPDYDAADDDTTLSKPSLLAHADAIRGPIWAPLNLKCRRANLGNTKRYVRSDVLSANLDIKLYDFAQLIIVVEHDSSLGTGMIGELWFEYDISFHTPCLDDGPSSTTILDTAPNTGYSASTVISPLVGLVGVEATDPVTTISSKVDNLPAAINAAGNLMIAEAGKYVVTFIAHTTTAAVSSIVNNLTSALATVTGISKAVDPITKQVTETSQIVVNDSVSTASPAQFIWEVLTGAVGGTLTYVAVNILPDVLAISGQALGSSYFGGEGTPLGILDMSPAARFRARNVRFANPRRVTDICNTICKRSSLTDPEAESSVSQEPETGEDVDIREIQTEFRKWYFEAISVVFPDDLAWERYGQDPVTASEMRADIIMELKGSEMRRRV